MTRATKISTSTTASLTSRIRGSFHQAWSVGSLLIGETTDDDDEQCDNSCGDGGADAADTEALDESNRCDRIVRDYPDLELTRLHYQLARTIPKLRHLHDVI